MKIHRLEKALTSHTNTPLPSLSGSFFPSDPCVFYLSILHTQRFPVLLLHSISMSYEGMREDERVGIWVCLGGIKEDTPSPTCLC